MQRIVGIGPTRVVLIAATATVLSASSALAQACIGYAQGRGGALSATVSFPEEVSRGTS